LEEYKLVPEQSIIFDLNPNEATLLFYLLGLLWAQSLTIDELYLLGNGLFEIAQVMFIIAAQRTLLNDAMKAQQEKENTE